MQIFRRPYETKAWQNRICPAETMVKIHPDRTTLAAGEETSSPYLTMEKESFTIWMKSLVFNTNGCTVFDSKGNIIYRVDNYNSKSCREVYLMDLHGHVLLTLRRQKFGLFKTWEGYGTPSGTAESTTNFEYFRVKNNMFKIPSKDSSSSYRVIKGTCKNDEQYCYKMVSRGSSLGIEESCGRLVAEVKRKQSRNGLELGDDVLTMVVESQVDHSFIIGLVLTHSLINCKL
ncbi:protein LURP-one-related 11-like [Raphanus sativus]|uniref:Protein LURP-one-related 11-like n=1 Tax=Raphanus sativus TaxID=3726 RepID=A0A9W3BXT8_RAPSA|nr:protein LURP-one-related 11-like [Raphanus sativus]